MSQTISQTTTMAADANEFYLACSNGDLNQVVMGIPGDVDMDTAIGYAAQAKHRDVVTFLQQNGGSLEVALSYAPEDFREEIQSLLPPLSLDTPGDSLAPTVTLANLPDTLSSQKDLGSLPLAPLPAGFEMPRTTNHSIPAPLASQPLPSIDDEERIELPMLTTLGNLPVPPATTNLASGAVGERVLLTSAPRKLPDFMTKPAEEKKVRKSRAKKEAEETSTEVIVPVLDTLGLKCTYPEEDKKFFSDTSIVIQIAQSGYVQTMARAACEDNINAIFMCKNHSRPIDKKTDYLENRYETYNECMYQAAKYQSITVLKYFLDENHKTKKDTQDVDKNYAMEGAAAGGHLKLLQCLIEIYKCDAFDSAMAQACENGKKEVMNYLLSLGKCSPMCKKCGKSINNH